MARNLVSIVKEKMIEYYAGDSRRVHHFLKVHSFAKLIAEMEGMEPDEMQVLEIACRSGEGMLSGGTSPHLQEYRRFGLSDTGGGRFPRQHV